MHESLVIIDKWITHADKERRTEHKIHFWMARDILEGDLFVSDIRIKNCIDFINKFTKESESKTVLLDALRKRLKGEKL